MLNRLKQFAHKIATDPARAGQAVLACILTVGVVALTLDIAPHIFPRQLKSDAANSSDVSDGNALDPLDPSYWEVLDGYQETSRELDKAKPLKENCESARSGKSYDTLLARFGDSFSGVLPGAGNLLNEHASMVSKRRERLIFEVMKKYANTKFCVQAGKSDESADESDKSVDEFRSVYQTEYSSLLGKLDLFLQVRLKEKGIATSLDQDNYLPRGMSLEEYPLAKKDLQTTQIHVAEIIDRAIESAIALDNWTERRVSNLTAKTTNKLSLGNNELTQVANNISNENVTTNSHNSGLLHEINRNLASTQPWPVGVGGAGVNDYRHYGQAYYGNTYPSEVYVPGSATIDSKKDDIAKNVTFGLLNLVDSDTRDDFLQNRFAHALALYVGATANIDPFAPGGEIEAKTALSEDKIKHDLCQSIGDTEGDCYSDDKPTDIGGTVENSVAIKSETDPALAAGMDVSEAAATAPLSTTDSGEPRTDLTELYTHPSSIVRVNIFQQDLDHVDVEHVGSGNN